MGTHPKSPSLVLDSRQVLSEHLASHPELIGKSVITKFNAGDGSLPFLFKVLSIEKALSIQTHPDKKTAEILHAQYPDIYKGIWLHEYLLLISKKTLQTQITNPKWLWP
jgi:mannose-6-phosphate isomerase